jgi:F-type H+-transporting ATPase subunit b
MLLGALLARVEEAPPPLIDVDGTLFLQLGLFILMWAVLSAVLFRPYLKMRAERARGIDGARHEAHRMEERARAIVADYDGRLARAKLRAQEERAQLTSEAATRERQLLGHAREEAHRAIEVARTKIAADAAAARAELELKSRDLARMMAKKILGRDLSA